jgi:phage terminase large subunit GpA-like protein
MSEQQPDLSTLPNRMRYAATVIDEADNRYGTHESGWDSGGLRQLADMWENDDRQAEAERSALADELATELYEAGWVKVSSAHVIHLIESGWRKGDPK